MACPVSRLHRHSSAWGLEALDAASAPALHTLAQQLEQFAKMRKVQVRITRYPAPVMHTQKASAWEGISRIARQPTEAPICGCAFAAHT